MGGAVAPVQEVEDDDKSFVSEVVDSDVDISPKNCPAAPSQTEAEVKTDDAKATQEALDASASLEKSFVSEAVDSEDARSTPATSPTGANGGASKGTVQDSKSFISDVVTSEANT